MKIFPKHKGSSRGFTLIELTVIIVVLLVLTLVIFFSGRAYIEASNRASCLTAQDKLKKSIISYGNLISPLQQGVEYYDNSNIESSFGVYPVCPETGGGYSATLAPSGEDVIVTCTDRGEIHQLDE
jgi:hypothetical protein